MMRLVALILVGTILPGPRASADAVKDDMDKLQGEWIAVKAIFLGKTSELSDGKERATVAGNKVTMKEQTGTFTLHPLTKPKTMQCSLVPNATWSYQIDGNTLTVAFGTVGAETPPDLEGKDGKYVLIYKRKTK